MDKKLIDKSDIKSAVKVRGILGNCIASMVMPIAGLKKINHIYSHISEYQGIEFSEKLTEYLNIKYDIIPEEFELIPKSGPFIIVSNHPFGGIDGITMLNIIGKVRPDLKILTNFILSLIPNLKEQFMPVNPFTDTPGLRSSVRGIKMAKEHLEGGGALGLFPAGEVSSNCNDENIVKDIEWQHSIIKLIRNAGVPVVPIYFDGGNSKIFHLMGKIHPRLRTIRLTRELANKKDSTITLRIGRQIPAAEIEEFSSDAELGRFLWNTTYALEANISDEQPDNAAKKEVYTTPMAEPVAKSVLTKEIDSLQDKALFTVGQFVCYLFDADKIPNTMQEIGRCREEAFRDVGEGTNNAIDTDQYDKYYKHLLLWDKDEKAIVGAYRLGIASEIISTRGLDGLYTNSLFRYDNKFEGHLRNSIELGRSFVSLAYQKEALPLMLLIKGLMYTVINYPDVKHLIGPVSISTWYPLYYRSLIIHYLLRKKTSAEFARHVSPKMPFVPDYKRTDADALLEYRMDSLEQFDRFIYRLSNNKFRLPTLLKKYLKMNARIIAFNVDPDFNYCVDGLIILNLSEMPKSEIDSLSKELEDKEMVYRRFDVTE